MSWSAGSRYSSAGTFGSWHPVKHFQPFPSMSNSMPRRQRPTHRFLIREVTTHPVILWRSAWWVVERAEPQTLRVVGTNHRAACWRSAEGEIAALCECVADRLSLNSRIDLLSTAKSVLIFAGGTTASDSPRRRRQ